MKFKGFHYDGVFILLIAVCAAAFTAMTAFYFGDKKAAIFVGAVFGAVRLIRNGQIKSHLINFQNYVFKTLTEKRITYYKTINEDLGKLHFCGCIFAACMMLYAGEEISKYGIF